MISVEDLQRRQRVAWDQFYEQFVHDIFGFVMHLVKGQRTLADDLFQEVWLQAIDSIATFDPQRGDLRSWLFGIARRRVALYWRKKFAADQRMELGNSASAEILIDGALLPPDLLEQFERAEIVRAALLVMSEDQRTALTHKYIDGLSVDQIATRTGKTPKAIESLLSRARSQLRTLVASEP